MLLLGLDVGSSSVKAALVDADSHECVASAFSPVTEMPIDVPAPGLAEQHPDLWWKHICASTGAALRECAEAGLGTAEDVAAVGISYQMHGLVLVDRDLEVLRPSIIWCDGRAVEIGAQAYTSLGADRCLERLLNSPGNFTASKAAWVARNEPELFERAHKMLLPGDWVAARMTGQARTTISGLSEGILWDFSENAPALFLLRELEMEPSLLPDLVPTFGNQGELTGSAAAELGLRPGTPVTYRAGDQPNNALSLNVTLPGEIAATAGTSGVIYGVSGEARHDPLSRVNTFVHVNHTGRAGEPARLGVLMYVNGTGILNSWLRRNVCDASADYEQMNSAASRVPVGSDGLLVLPFGNGAERIPRTATSAAACWVSTSTATAVSICCAPAKRASYSPWRMAWRCCEKPASSRPSFAPADRTCSRARSSAKRWPTPQARRSSCSLRMEPKERRGPRDSVPVSTVRSRRCSGTSRLSPSLSRATVAHTRPRWSRSSAGEMLWRRPLRKAPDSGLMTRTQQPTTTISWATVSEAGAR